MAAHQLPPKPMFTQWQGPRKQSSFPRGYREDDRDRDMPPTEGGPSYSHNSGTARGQDMYIPRDSRDSYPPHPPSRDWERERQRDSWDRERDRVRERDRSEQERDYRGPSGSAVFYGDRQGWDERDSERFRRERDPRPELSREHVVRDWERDRINGRHDRESYRRPYPARRPGTLILTIIISAWYLC